MCMSTVESRKAPHLAKAWPMHIDVAICEIVISRSRDISNLHRLITICAAEPRPAGLLLCYAVAAVLW